ncbi:PREDICTED: spidroin-1-like, partial [Chinchilla lanigera]|uniref:spidroin-1-like n=1 Tax=Chinchilla lanigera TaxID=34839 RepID=UPI00069833D7
MAIHAIPSPGIWEPEAEPVEQDEEIQQQTIGIGISCRRRHPKSLTAPALPSAPSPSPPRPRPLPPAKPQKAVQFQPQHVPRPLPKRRSAAGKGGGASRGRWARASSFRFSANPCSAPDRDAEPEAAGIYWTALPRGRGLRARPASTAARGAGHAAAASASAAAACRCALGGGGVGGGEEGGGGGWRIERRSRSGAASRFGEGIFCFAVWPVLMSGVRGSGRGDRCLALLRVPVSAEGRRGLSAARGAAMVGGVAGRGGLFASSPPGRVQPGSGAALPRSSAGRPRSPSGRLSRRLSR